MSTPREAELRRLIDQLQVIIGQLSVGALSNTAALGVLLATLTDNMGLLEVCMSRDVAIAILCQRGGHPVDSLAHLFAISTAASGSALRGRLTAYTGKRQNRGRWQIDCAEQDYRVKRVLRFLEEQCARSSINLPEAAQIAGVSRSHLARLIRHCTGMSFGGCLRITRIRHATRLLSESDLSIKEIAKMTGYSSVVVLDRQFKKTTGLNPSEFRRTAFRQDTAGER